MTRILIIEDEPSICCLLEQTLEELGEHVRIDIAYTGEDGMTMLERHPPSLIIADLMMPRMNGYEVCRAVRALGMTCPIILLTARGNDEESMDEGMQAGATAWMAKPFDPDMLVEQVRDLLGGNV